MLSYIDSYTENIIRMYWDLYDVFLNRSIHCFFCLEQTKKKTISYCLCLSSKAKIRNTIFVFVLVVRNFAFLQYVHSLSSIFSLRFKTTGLKFRIQTPHINAKKGTNQNFKFLSRSWDVVKNCRNYINDR